MPPAREKETVEAVGESHVAQTTARPKPDAGQLRSDAVSLDVPVKVHGSRIVEVIRGTTPHTEPFEEKTSTMIVFPLGGVLKMTTAVSIGQAIVLTNLKTSQDAICRVVKIRTNPNLHSYVEVEFSHPQPGYWGVRFPSDRPEPPKKTVSVSPAVSAPLASQPSPAKTLSPQKAAVPAPDFSAKFPAPPHEDAPSKNEKRAPEPRANAIAQPPASAAVPDAASFSLDELRGDGDAAPAAPSSLAASVESCETVRTESHPAADSSAANETSGIPGISTPNTLASSAPARPLFGAALDYSLGTAGGEEAQDKERNWTLIGVCAGVLLAVAGAGGFYFLHKRPATAEPAQSVVPAATPAAVPGSPVIAENSAPNAAPLAEAPAQQQAATAQTGAAPVTTVAPSAVAPSVAARAETPAAVTRTPEATPGKVSKAAADGTSRSPFQPGQPSTVKRKPATVMPDMFGALNAHPTAAVHSSTSSAGAAPSIDAGALPSGQGIAIASSEPSPSNLAPPPSAPQPESRGPVRVGGDVKPPQLISSPRVAYPDMARQAGIQGDVVVRILIDKAGNVTDARVVSGPLMLRDAALDALRQRKYAPSKLDGRPVSVEMLVTIQFHL